jgi:hypothetical protein
MSKPSVVFSVPWMFPLNFTPGGVKKSGWVTAAEFFITVILAVAFFAVAMLFYFFVIAKKIEGQAVVKNTDRVVKAIVKPILAVITPLEKENIENALNESLTPPDMKKTDEEVAEKNKMLMQKAFFWMGSGFVISVLLVLLIFGSQAIYAKYRFGANAVRGLHYPNLGNIVIEVIILTAFVFIAELIFLVIVALQWQSVDVYHIEMKTLEVFRNFIIG